MTATPIPRTVAMTVFGDLEVSTLSELPAGRAPIQTNVVPLAEHPGWIERVWARVKEEVDKGHQAYVVCPRITGDEQEEGDRDVIDMMEEEFVDTPHARSPPATGRRSTPSPRWSSDCARGPWRGCVSRCCTAGCRPTRRTA